MCAGVTSFGVFSPNKTNSNQIAKVNKALNASSYLMLSQLNKTATALISGNSSNSAAGLTLASQVKVCVQNWELVL